MKLLAMVMASVLALPVAAHADEVLSGPQRAKNHALKQALMAQFDKNGDGKLEPRERMRAVRVLRRIEMKLAGKGGKGQRRQRFIQRFDTNHDGNVDQSEMPPGAARKLRRFDRDGDGWVEPGEAQ
jgi:Ca2+-binding EF-hand superfamily protein